MKKILGLLAVVLMVSGCASTGAVGVRPGSEVSAVRGPIGERYVLDNGMVLLVKTNHALPVVMVNVIIKAGAVMEPPEKAGLANFTAGLLTRGAAGMKAEDISEAIDYIGGSLSASGGEDYASAGLTVLKKDVDTGFDLLAKVLMKPAFDEGEIERFRREVKAGILRSEQDPEDVAGKTFARAVFGPKHPYGIPVEGTMNTVDGITRDDIVAFHEAYYAPNNCIMAVVGDITAGEAKALVSRYMAGWERKTIPYPVFPPTPTPKGAEMIKINRDITQASVLMGHLGVRRGNPDYYRLQVMDYILGGGGFVSRILDRIRDDMGLAYSAYSYFYPRKYAGSFQAGLQTRNATAKVAIDETLKVIEQMKEAPVTDAELRDAKDYITGSFPMKMDTNAKMASLLTQVEFYNLGLDYFDMYEREITKVTKEDIQEAARKYLHPDNIYIVVVGNLKEAGMK